MMNEEKEENAIEDEWKIMSEMIIKKIESIPLHVVFNKNKE